MFQHFPTKFRLRTLLIGITLLCAYLAYWVYDISLKGDFRTGNNIRLTFTEPLPIAKQVRERTRGLPGHLLADKPLFELSKHFMRANYEVVRDARVVDSFFYRVKLSDGSETDVGFWIYDKIRTTGRPEAGATVVMHAHDSYPAVLNGTAEKRRQERFALFKNYRQILFEIQWEIETANDPQLSGRPAPKMP